MVMRYRDYFLRPTSWKMDIKGYSDPVQPDEMPKDVAHFFKLYQDCFLHHVRGIQQDKGDDLRLINDEAGKRTFLQDALAAYFLKHIYKPNPITYCSNASEIDKAKNTKSLTQFVNEIAGSPIAEEGKPQHPNSISSNRINFLIGDVGIGKSLLTSKAISLIYDSNKNNKSHYVLPVYIDFDSELRNSEKLDDIDEKFITLVQSATRTLLSKIESWNEDYNIPPMPDPAVEFINLNRKLLENNIRLFLIFDNTDRYHFYYSKYSFNEEFRSKQSEVLNKNFSKLFRTFSSVEHLGDQALSILFVCRKSVLKRWMSSGQPENNVSTLIKDYGVFQVEKIKEIDAIESRFELMEKAIEAIAEAKPTQAEEYSVYLEKIKESILDSINTNHANSLNMISKLTHHGTRSLIDFLGAFKLDYRSQYEITNRVFSRHTNLLRLYITNFRKKYSQLGDHFPNLFLVDAVVLKNKEFEKLHKGHMHTYWLKYLLLKRIVKSFQNDQVVTYQTLKEEFVEDCGYEEHLFELTLGSLNTVNSFRCIEIVEDDLKEDQSIRIIPTSRGIALLEPLVLRSEQNEETVESAEFCFNFNYLQFVIDDTLLSIPQAFKEEVYCTEDIGYLFSANAQYYAYLLSYLKAKSRAVLFFIHILKHAAEFEVSNRLRDREELQNLLPDFDHIFTDTLDFYERIFNQFSKDEDKAYSYVLKELHNSLQNSKDLNKFFSSYAESKCDVAPS